MSIEQLKSFTSIVSVDPYNHDYIRGVSSFLASEKSPEYSKQQYAISYLNTKAYINNQVEISKNIPDEDLLDAINIKVYDELGLDQAIEYQIQYIELFSITDGDNRFFQVFIVNPLEIDETYKEVVQTIKYIDTITPAPLLIKSLYSKEIIQDTGIHCFIYFEKNDAFITIYNEKDFVYTKSLKYSLQEMHERFCELYGERIEYDAFISFLLNEKLKYTDSDYKEYILKLYKEIFLNINDILTYAKKAFNIEKVERVYIGSQIDMASKLYEISEVELSISSHEFNFDYGFDTNDVFINQIHALMHLTATLDDNQKYLCNFSTFHRPPKFVQRQSGKIIMLVAASLIIAFAYPVTYWVLAYGKKVQHELLQQTYTEVHTKMVTRQANIKSREVDKAKALALLKVEEDAYTEKKNTLVKIHDVKVNYPMKAKIITRLMKDLNKYSVKIEKINYNENDENKKFTLSLISSNDKKITELLEYLTKEHDNKFKFSLENISYKEDNKLYFSELKVNIL